MMGLKLISLTVFLVIVPVLIVESGWLIVGYKPLSSFFAYLVLIFAGAGVAYKFAHECEK